MSAGAAAALSLRTAPERKVPRYKLTVPLDLTVLRSGIPDNISGRTLEIGEGGMGVIAPSPLLLGESVRVEFLLPQMTSPVRATAVVRYQREGCFGLQFLRLPVEQRSIIRYWIRREAEILLAGQELRCTQSDTPLAEPVATPAQLAESESSDDSKRRLPIRRIVVLGAAMIAITAMLGWWRWQQGWAELDAHVSTRETVVAKPQLKVTADAMQRRITHQVPPEYPEDARRVGEQGTVLLNAVVGVDGDVTQLKVVSGPRALSVAAMDAVRWWRYEPYSVNGQPTTVETTIAVNFSLANQSPVNSSKTTAKEARTRTGGAQKPQ